MIAAASAAATSRSPATPTTHWPTTYTPSSTRLTSTTSPLWASRWVAGRLPGTVHGSTDRLRSVVFACAIPPYLLNTNDNPDGPLTKKAAAGMAAALTKDQDSFYDGFITEFFSVDNKLLVTENQRQHALTLAGQANKEAALAWMTAFGTTDFRDDLAQVSVPALIVHGDADSIVPFEGSGKRTHEALPNSQVHLIEGAPHGATVSHSDEFNRVLLDFLSR